MKYKYIGPEELLTACRFKDGHPDYLLGDVCNNGSCPGHVMGQCPFRGDLKVKPEFDMFFIEVHDD